jgi:phenylalanyl-tRNA synthetase alpha chain
MALSDELEAIRVQVREGLKQAESLEALEQVRVAATGKKGTLTSIMRMMGKLAPEERPAMGKLANTVRADVETMIHDRKLELEQQALHDKIAGESVDITLPGRCLSIGTQHLITQIREEIEDVFCGLGNTVEDGPYIEDVYHNFTALNAPVDHPSRAASDTFYVVDNAPEGKGDLGLSISDVLLRTQTSGVQVHVMEERSLPST